MADDFLVRLVTIYCGVMVSCTFLILCALAILRGTSRTISTSPYGSPYGYSSGYAPVIPVTGSMSPWAASPFTPHPYTSSGMTGDPYSETRRGRMHLPVLQQYQHVIEGMAAYIKDLESTLHEMPMYTPGGSGVERAYLDAKDEWIGKHKATLQRIIYNPEHDRRVIQNECLNKTKQVLNAVRMNNHRHNLGDSSVQFLDIASTIGMIEEEYKKLQ